MSRPPNIILTIADDQRGSALGCAGLEAVSTPALDSLAARGTRFSQAQHFGSCHGAVCAPSRAMLHTGLPYFRLGKDLLEPGHASVPAPGTPTLGEKLRTFGYDCFGTGKWHNGAPSFHASFNGGANIFFGGMNDHWSTPVHDFDPSGDYPRAARRRAEGFSTEVFAQSAIDFIRSRAGGSRPFFCYCAFTAPHDPRTPPDAWLRRYPPRDVALPPNVVPGFFSDDSPSPRGVRPALDIGSLDERDELLLGIPRDIREIQRAVAAYYGMISHMDEWIARIHQAIAAIGQLENTIIVHTADHGLALGQHGLMGKQNLFQHSLQVPLILAGPGIPAGLLSEKLSYQHDLHPTLVELAGGASEKNVFQSLFDSKPRRHAASSFRDTQRSIRDARHKLIEYQVRGRRFSHLFDLGEDPWETRDLSEEPRFRPVIEDLRKALRQSQAEAGDPLSLP